jgi:NAD(P)-dependent dehydrogenase (short-subunit alcohol dehydrogenase family)
VRDSPTSSLRSDDVDYAAPADLTDRVAIVTGASRGIGLAIADAFTQAGANVVITARKQHELDEALSSLPEGQAISCAGSADNPDAVVECVDTTMREFGRVDIVVNNAGILRDAAFKNVTPALLDAVIDVHLKGAFNVLRTAWPHLREQNYGRVVNTSSGSGLFGNFGQSNYGAAKAGLMGLTRVLSIEGARNNVMANAIAPIAHTRMTEGQIDESMAPELISPLVAYLCHASCAVTGQAYSVGGGRVSRVFLGMTTGVTDSALTAETVADRIDEIDDTREFVIRW